LSEEEPGLTFSTWGKTGKIGRNNSSHLHILTSRRPWPDIGKSKSANQKLRLSTFLISIEGRAVSINKTMFSEACFA
jgi:hypothetical protein